MSSKRSIKYRKELKDILFKIIPDSKRWTICRDESTLAYNYDIYFKLKNGEDIFLTWICFPSHIPITESIRYHFIVTELQRHKVIKRICQIKKKY